VTEQLVLALGSWTEQRTAWEIVRDQVPEPSWQAAIAECARLVTQALPETEHDDGEGDERAR
jgi:hypothetical protein